jgi:hypothetical protein
MNKMRVALATCVKLPEPDRDQDLLLSALRARGVEGSMLAWDDPHADASTFDACVLRSTWNYYHALPEFLAWAERTARITSLWNPLPVIRWNTHKRYLRDLAARGVPTVPTAWIEKAGSTTLRDALRELGARTVVVKPAVSAASFDTVRVHVEDVERAEQHVGRVRARCDVMVQPYVQSVEGYGERSIIWIDGAFTHAIRKSPRFGGEHENVSEALPIADDERALATAALQAAPQPLLYARIDVARDAAGAPMIMELELLEPSLFLKQSPEALRRFADAITARTG